MARVFVFSPSSSAGAYTDDEGASWTTVTGPLAAVNTARYFPSLSKFFVGGVGGVRYSTDGLSWTASTGMPNTVMDLVWTGSKLFALSNNLDLTGVFGQSAESMDGVAFTRFPDNFTNDGTQDIRSVVWMGSQFLCANYGASTARLRRSADGYTWTIADSRSPWSCAVGATDGTIAVFAAYGSTPQMITTTDGITWTNRSAPVGFYVGMCHAAGKFVAVAPTSSTAAVSADGITWSGSTLPSAGTWTDVIWTGTNFMAVGTSLCATSPDGVTWTARAASSVSSPKAVAGPAAAAPQGGDIILPKLTQGPSSGRSSSDSDFWTGFIVTRELP